MPAPEFIEKMKQGPVGIMSIWPNGEINMGKLLGQWFVYSLSNAVLAAYITGRVLLAVAALTEDSRKAIRRRGTGDP